MDANVPSTGDVREAYQLSGDGSDFKRRFFQRGEEFDAWLKSLPDMSSELVDAVTRAHELIGNQAGDVTGAALDAWVILGDALRRVSDPQRRNGE